jgi:hypothetical protein
VPINNHPINDQDDERLESYLKEFCPIAAGPLCFENQGRTPQPRLVYGAGAIAAGLVVAALLASYHRATPRALTKDKASFATGEQLLNAPPLTLGSANNLLSTSSSLKAAVDQLSIQSRSIPLSNGKHSALSILSKEKPIYE